MSALTRLAKTVLVSVAVALATVVATRALLLPDSTCTVTQSVADSVKLELAYDRVRDILGCEGVRVSGQDWGEIRQDIYHWRGDAWPFGRFEAVFYNRVLHQTRKLWFNLNVTLPATERAR